MRPRPGVDRITSLRCPFVNDGRCLVERRLDLPRHIDVYETGQWWPGVQHAWRMYDDGTGWRAAVRFVVAGPAEELDAREADVPRERIRDRRPRRGTRKGLVPRRP